MDRMEARSNCIDVLSYMVAAGMPLEINSDMIFEIAGSPVHEFLTEITTARRQCRMFGIDIEATAAWGYAEAMLTFDKVSLADAKDAILAYQKSKEE